MADIRLNKILRQFNIGLDDLVKFLNGQGVEVEANPNSKISEEFLPAITKQFGKDLELKQAADKVDIKITEIIEKGRRQPKEEELDEEPEQETIIKSNTLSGPAPVATPVAAPVQEPEPIVETRPVEEEQPSSEAVKAEEEPVSEPEPQPVEDTVPEKEAEPEIEPQPEESSEPEIVEEVLPEP